MKIMNKHYHNNKGMNLGKIILIVKVLYLANLVPFPFASFA